MKKVQRTVSLKKGEAQVLYNALAEQITPKVIEGKQIYPQLIPISIWNWVSCNMKQLKGVIAELDELKKKLFQDLGEKVMVEGSPNYGNHQIKNENMPAFNQAISDWVEEEESVSLFCVYENQLKDEGLIQLNAVRGMQLIMEHLIMEEPEAETKVVELVPKDGNTNNADNP